MTQRSGCPINLATEAIGDRWSMILLRDIMFGDHRSYRDLLNNSLEGIATNILGNRLRTLVAEGFLTAAPDPDHKQRTVYSLTEKSIALLPALIALGAWGRQFYAADPAFAVRNQLLEEGGRELQDAFMDELRERHLELPNAWVGERVSEQLQAAFEARMAERIGADTERST
ncbi:winged helix-turn-helix transcriptional regulator [Pseudooceanicola sp. LIPI14-2-Ac024]|uniref:winged helix-turn-helix transcriptional regulator n=1 Tax=Pseudooceanicola sp. LIPI14-2-Ac024 TaxID=3344875 RepID=UPI0035D115A1